MKCSDIYGYLSAYLDRELDSEIQTFVERHLVSCSSCKYELGLYEAIKLLVRRKLSGIHAPECLRDRVLAELGRAEEYRESGIQVLDLVHWGTHIAQLYDGKNELTEVLTPYLGRGLEDNEFCIWVTFEISKDEAIDALIKEVEDTEKYIEKGQLQIFSYKDWYLPEGRFDYERVLNNGFKKYQDALSSGYSGVRITGSACWVDKSDWDYFMEYENFFNSIISDYKLLALCAYKEGQCGKDNIVDVMNTHKYVISKVDNSWRLRRSAE